MTFRSSEPLDDVGRGVLRQAAELREVVLHALRGREALREGREDPRGERDVLSIAFKCL